MTGNEVRTRRLSLGWTQDVLSEASGLSRRTIQNIEAGTANPSSETIKCLSAALGLPPKRSDRPSDPSADEAEVQALMSYWVDPADEKIDAKAVERLAWTGLWLAASLVLAATAKLAPDGPVQTWILGVPIVSASIAFAFLMRGAMPMADARTEADVDDERASFRERIRRDGLDAWRVPVHRDEVREKDDLRSRSPS